MLILLEMLHFNKIKWILTNDLWLLLQFEYCNLDKFKMARAKYGIDSSRQSPEESKHLILRSDINKTIYHPIVGKLA